MTEQEQKDIEVMVNTIRQQALVIQRSAQLVSALRSSVEWLKMQNENLLERLAEQEGHNALLRERLETLRKPGGLRLKI